jgi:GntR family transcriptional regulator, rspAB operon transcriptional repressor
MSRITSTGSTASTSRRQSTGRSVADGRSLEGRRSGGLTERVRAHVYEQIVSGKLKPGSIIQIANIAHELEVSRTPVREALLALQQAKLLSVVPNQGFLIRPISLTDVRDIFMMRGLLEGATTERAAERIGQDDVARLSEINDQARARADLGHYDMAFDQACYDFHRTIAVLSGSERLLSAVTEIFDDYRRLQTVGVNPPDPTIVVDQHDAICQALAEGNPQAARSQMGDHIETLRQRAVSMIIN